MATAALLKPDQRLLDSIKAYTDQILMEPYSDEKLKATLLKDYVSNNKINISTLQYATGFSASDINSYLAKAYDDQTQAVFDNRPYQVGAREKIKRQIKIQKDKLHLTYPGGAGEDFVINDMAAYLASYGFDSVLDLAGFFGSIQIPAGSIVQPLPEGQGEGFSHAMGYMGGTEANSEFIVTALHPVDASKVILGENGYVTTENITLPNSDPDYFYNKITGQKLPVSRNGGSEFWGTNQGKGITQYHIKFTNTGLPVFYTVPQSTGFMADYGDLLQMAAIVATVLGVPAFLGEYIVGADAALANPALSQTIGKVAMNTVLTGGDITGQLSKAVLGVPGAFVGDFVGTGLDSAQIGKVAEAVTSAKLQGGNVAAAALLTLTNQGAKSMGEYDAEIPFDFENQIQYGDMSLTDIGVSFDAVALEAAMNYNEQLLFSSGVDPLSMMPDSNGNIFSFTGELLEPTEAAYGMDYYAASDGSVKDVFNRTIINPEDAANMSAAEIEQQLYNDWSRSQGQEVDTQPGDKLRPADKASVGTRGKVPSITDQAYVADKLLKTAVSIGASIKAISNGTFRTQNPNMYSPYGTARPQAVGVPMQQPDGSIITNNGNGTQTIRRPNGTVQTVPTSYMPSNFGTSAFGGISQQTLLIGGAVLLGAFLLTRRK